MTIATSNVSFAAQEWSGLAHDAAQPDGAEAAARLEPLADKLRTAEQELELLAAAIELLGKLEASRDLRHACFSLVNELQGFLNCHQVALGLCRGRKRSCRLQAVSGMPQFDPRSEFVRSVEAAMDECLLRDRPTAWPTADDAERHGTRAHQKLCNVAGIPSVHSLPLRDAAGDAVGTLLFVGTDGLGEQTNFAPFLRACEAPVGRSLDLIRRAEPGPIARAVKWLTRHRKAWQLNATLAGATLLAAALALPMPYKIGCDCQVQPVTRRFVAAPFEGTLEKSLVKQGDLIRAGQLLARLDGREIRWELAGLVAERARAAKQRDSALATGKVADAQSAKLETERLDLKIQVLEHRAENLEVKSPIDGVVVSGDLDKAEGAPLTVGQTLFEIAPLEAMVVELAIPEDEIAHASVGQPVRVRLDAQPGQTWNATIAKIHPRSEIRDARNVFIAEFDIDNPAGVLRPGMNGRAKIVAAKHAVAWNLFHKPLDWLSRTLGW